MGMCVLPPKLQCNTNIMKHVYLLAAVNIIPTCNLYLCWNSTVALLSEHILQFCLSHWDLVCIVSQSDFVLPLTYQLCKRAAFCALKATYLTARFEASLYLSLLQSLCLLPALEGKTGPLADPAGMLRGKKTKKKEQLIIYFVKKRKMVGVCFIPSTIC